MSFISSALGLASDTFQFIDRKVQSTAPWKLVAITAGVVALGTFHAVKWMQRNQWDWGEVAKSGLRQVPSIRTKLHKEVEKLQGSLEKKFFDGINPDDICDEIPDEAWQTERILDRLKSVAGEARSGKNTGAYYIDNEELDRLILEVCKLARRTNPLHTDLSPLIRQLEAEIVRMTLSMFHGEDTTVGNVTSGGTDSIRHAVFTARERARANGHSADWEMVVPVTAHPAFAKAANEYGIKIKYVDVYPQGHEKAYQLNVGAMRKAITGNTILVAGSMPPYPHGIPDNIEEISAMLEQVDPKGRIGLHVDCCLGGFVVPWMEAAGYGKDVGTHFGFDVKRVTSISADTHKYGYGEKGTSVVMYRDHENWRKHQIFVSTEWPGGIYATPTQPGSRSGRDIATLWAVMAYLGKDGYINETRKLIKVTRDLTQAIREDDYLKNHIEIMGDPKMMVIGLTTKSHEELNVYDLKTEMAKKGWYLAGLQKPPGLHFCMTAVQGNDDTFVDTFIKDLKECVLTVYAYPTERKGKSSDAAMYCTNETFGEKMFLPDVAREFWNIAGRVKPVSTT